MIDVSELIVDPDFAMVFPITRVGGHFVESGLEAGEWIVESGEPFDVTGIIHPNATPDDLLVLPEGLRTLRAILVFTLVPLRFGDGKEAADVETDYVSYQGKSWKIAHVTDWSEHGYYFGIAIDAAQLAANEVPV